MTLVNLITERCFQMFYNVLKYIIPYYNLKISPKYIIGSNKMEKDDEDISETSDSWNEYLKQYQYEDFFEEDEPIEVPQELMEPFFKNDLIYANPICNSCNVETLTLLKEQQKVFLSKCPKCLTSYKNNSSGE